jgi:hypothetical protein
LIIYYYILEFVKTMEPKFQIAICGGGNLAHGTVAVVGHNNPKYVLNVLSRRPEVWDSKIVAHT